MSCCPSAPKYLHKHILRDTHVLNSHSGELPKSTPEILSLRSVCTPRLEASQSAVSRFMQFLNYVVEKELDTKMEEMNYVVGTERKKNFFPCAQENWHRYLFLS